MISSAVHRRRCRHRTGGTSWYISNGEIFVSETLGTAMLLLLGCGVVATAILKGSKGEGGGWLLINFGWGLARLRRRLRRVPQRRPPEPGGHPRQLMIAGNITVGAGRRSTSAASCSAPSSAPSSPGWRSSSTSTPRRTRARSSAVFSTGPAIRNYGWNTVTEIIGTFVLIFVILISGGTPTRGSGRCSSRCWSSASAPRSVARPATPSTRPVTSAPASRTPSCRSRARAARTGATPGCRSSARIDRRGPGRPACSWPTRRAEPDRRRQGRRRSDRLDAPA